MLKPPSSASQTLLSLNAAGGDPNFKRIKIARALVRRNGALRIISSGSIPSRAGTAGILSCVLRLLCLLLVIAATGVPSAHPGDDAFSIDDYFRVQRVTEVALSSNGRTVAYAVESQSLDENKTMRAVYISATVRGAAPARIESIQGARSLAWIPGKEELAFLSDRNGTTQIFSYDLRSKSSRRYTDSADPVVRFRFAPNGSLAYITQKKSESTSLYEQMQTGDQGLLIDSDLLRVQHFTDPGWGYGESASPHRLWLAGEGGGASVKLPGEADDIHWSPDSARLAVTYGSSEPSTSLFAQYRTSLGVYDVEQAQFRIVAEATPARPGAQGTTYDSGGWLSEDMVIVLRATITDIFVSPRHLQWAALDQSRDRPLADESLIWRELSLTGLDHQPLFHCHTDGTVLINKTVRGGNRSLYVTTGSNALKRSHVAGDAAGNISMIRFSASFDRAVFISDSLTRPPEIYSWREGEASRRLTALNQDLAERRMPVAREVRWKSSDGAEIQGWLLLPEEPEAGQSSWPFITFVHGGPSLSMPTDFAGYFSIWPYPFEVYALNGMAVFFPNYRGSTTFGREYASPTRLDGEPVEDIITGVKYLIEQGVADPNRLAISGHSHGAWLGPLALTRAAELEFQAASFAEGWGNNVTVYDIMSGRLNRELHDAVFGASLYDKPKRYLELSPALHFKGLRTASLFEAGSHSLAITMMSYPKAARHVGMATEYYVYPRTGHNPAMPRIQKESAIRNLGWFRFWLQGYEDPDVEKGEQYARWGKMRDERCAKLQNQDNAPLYCRY